MGPDHPTLALTLSNLALNKKSLGHLSEAEALYKRALTIAEKALGPDHPDLAKVLGNLAILLQSQNRNAEAEPIFKRAQLVLEKSKR